MTSYIEVKSTFTDLVHDAAVRQPDIIPQLCTGRAPGGGLDYVFHYIVMVTIHRGNFLLVLSSTAPGLLPCSFITLRCYRSTEYAHNQGFCHLTSGNP